jgi:hypothetical protein
VAISPTLSIAISGPFKLTVVACCKKQLHVKITDGESSAKGLKRVVCVHRFEIGYLGKTTMDVTLLM